MKCDDCLNLLAEYIDGEAIEHDAERISAHLITCAGCTGEFEALTAEQEIFARYDRELSISPSMWQAIEARTAPASRQVDASSRVGLREWFTGLFTAPRFGYAFAGALAVSIIAVVIGVMYLRIHQQPAAPGPLAGNGKQTTPPVVPSRSDMANAPAPITSPSPGEETVAPLNERIVAQGSAPKHTGKQKDDPGVLFKEIAYSEQEERDTAEHIRQAENLLRSIRNLQASDGQSTDDSEIDVSYEKAMSQRLLNENAVLLQDAEVAGKFPTKELLKDLEPFLIDIANLPDKTTANQLRELKARVQKTEIVAALMSY